MNKRENKVRSKMVVVRLNQEEYIQLQKFIHQSTERTTSSYLRKLALKRPVTVKYRHTSADDFLREMVELKKELSALGNNYNQAVKKLHLLEKVPEFRGWILTQENSRKAFLKKVDEIHLKVAELYEQWLQK